MDQASYNEALKIAVRALRISATSGSICSDNSDEALTKMAEVLKTDKGLFIAKVDDKAF